MADEAPDKQPPAGSKFPHLNLHVVNTGSSTGSGGSSGSSSGTSTASLSSAGLPLVSSLPVQLDAGRVVNAYSYLPPQTVHLQGVAGNTQQQQIPSSVASYPSIHGWGTTSHLPVPCYGPVAYPYRNVAATSPMEQLYGHPNLQPVPSLQLVHMQPPGQRPIQPTTVQDGRGVCYYNHAVLTPIPMRQASPMVQTAVPVPSAPTNKVVLLLKKVEPQRSETIRANVALRQEHRPVVVYHIPETPADPEECKSNLIDPLTVLPRALETTPSSLDDLTSENINVLATQPGTQEAHQPPLLPPQDQESVKRDSNLVDFMDEFQLPQDLLNTDQFPDIEKLIASIEPLLPECLFPPIDPKEATQVSYLQEMPLEGAKANKEVKNIKSETQEKSILEMQTIKEACVHPERTSILPVTRKSENDNAVPVIDLCDSEDEILRIHKPNISSTGQNPDEHKSILNPAITIGKGSFPQRQKTVTNPMPFVPRAQHVEVEGISTSGQGPYEQGGADFENAMIPGTIYTIDDGGQPTPKELIAPKDTTRVKYLKKTKKANSHTLGSRESHSSTKVTNDLQLPKDKRKTILTKEEPLKKTSGKSPAIDKSRSKGSTTGSEKVPSALQLLQISGVKNKKHLPQQREEALKRISTKHMKVATDTTGLRQGLSDACSEQNEAKRSHEEETKKPTQELIVKRISTKHVKLAVDTTELKRVQRDAYSGQHVAKRSNLEETKKPTQVLIVKGISTNHVNLAADTTGLKRVQNDACSEHHVVKKSHVEEKKKPNQEPSVKGISTKHVKLAGDTTGLKHIQSDACSGQHVAKRSHVENTKKLNQEPLVKGISTKHVKVSSNTTGLKRVQSNTCSEQHVAKRSHEEETKKPNQDLLVKGISTKHVKLSSDTAGLERVQSDACSEQHEAKRSHEEETKKPNQDLLMKGISTKHVKFSSDTAGLERVQSDACSEQHVAKRSHEEETKKPNQDLLVKGISTKDVKLSSDTAGLERVQSDACSEQHEAKRSHEEETKKPNQDLLVNGISTKHVKFSSDTAGLERVQSDACSEQHEAKRSHEEETKKPNQDLLVKRISTKDVKLSSDTAGLERVQSDACSEHHVAKRSHVEDTKKLNQEPLVKGISTKHVKFAADTTGLKRVKSDACSGQHVAKISRIEEKKKPNQEPLVKGISTKHVKVSSNTTGLKRVQSDACSEQHVANRSHEEETKKPNQDLLVKGITTKHVKLAADTTGLKRVKSDACSGQHVAKRSRGEETKKPNQKPLVKEISTKHVKLPGDTRQVQKDACSEQHVVERSHEQETKKPSQELTVKGISTKQVNLLADFTMLKEIQSEQHVAKRLVEEQTKKSQVKEKIKIFIPPSESLDKKLKKNLGGEPNASHSRDLQISPNNSETVKNMSKEQCKDKAKTNANPAGTKGKKKVGKIETETVKQIPRSNLALHMMESVQVFYPLGKSNLSALPSKKIPSVTSTVTSSHTIPEKTPSMPPRPLPKSQSNIMSRQQPTTVSKPMPTLVTKPSSTSLPKASSLSKPVTSSQTKPLLRQELKPPISGPSGWWSAQVSQASSWRPSAVGSTYVHPKLPDNQMTGPWKPRDIRKQVLPNISVSVPHPSTLPKHFVSHTVRPSSPVQEFNGATFIPWRTPPDDLEESTPITEEQRPIREMMKKRAQREREEAACWTSVGRVKFFVEREKEMNTSIRFGYPWRR